MSEEQATVKGTRAGQACCFGQLVRLSREGSWALQNLISFPKGPPGFQLVYAEVMYWYPPFFHHGAWRNVHRAFRWPPIWALTRFSLILLRKVTASHAFKPDPLMLPLLNQCSQSLPDREGNACSTCSGILSSILIYSFSRLSPPVQRWYQELTPQINPWYPLKAKYKLAA